MTPGQELSAAMAALANNVGTATEARKIQRQFSDRNARGMWAAVWGIETCRRAIALREKDPFAQLPPEWVPIAAE